MTNWLITQTTRFKAAVTGAGAVEHAANWGNDDLTWDDAWYLSADAVGEARAIPERSGALPDQQGHDADAHRGQGTPMCG